MSILQRVNQSRWKSVHRHESMFPYLTIKTQSLRNRLHLMQISYAMSGRSNGNIIPYHTIPIGRWTSRWLRCAMHILMASRETTDCKSPQWSHSEPLTTPRVRYDVQVSHGDYCNFPHVRVRCGYTSSYSHMNWPRTAPILPSLAYTRLTPRIDV